MKFFSISGFFCGFFRAIPNAGAVLPLRRMNDLICHPKQMRKKKDRLDFVQPVGLSLPGDYLSTTFTSKYFAAMRSIVPSAFRSLSAPFSAALSAASFLRTP